MAKKIGKNHQNGEFLIIFSCIPLENLNFSCTLPSVFPFPHFSPPSTPARFLLDLILFGFLLGFFHLPRFSGLIPISVFILIFGSKWGGFSIHMPLRVQLYARVTLIKMIFHFRLSLLVLFLMILATISSCSTIITFIFHHGITFVARNNNLLKSLVQETNVYGFAFYLAIGGSLIQIFVSIVLTIDSIVNCLKPGWISVAVR